MARYNWEGWLKSARRTLTRGKDFMCSPLSMAQQVRNAASTLGVSVSVRVYGDKVVIVRRREPAVA